MNVWILCSFKDFSNLKNRNEIEYKDLKLNVRFQSSNKIYQKLNVIVEVCVLFIYNCVINIQFGSIENFILYEIKL